MNIVLIGYRGTGKSTVAKIIAQKLKMTVFEMDVRIREKAGLSIPEMVAQFGWEHFRNLESETAIEASQLDNCIIDTGGGIITRADNIEVLKRKGVVFWLKADLATILGRIEDSTDRPSLTGKKSFLEEIEEVLKERTPKYHSSADYSIDTAPLTPEKIADRIIVLFKQEKKNYSK
ncbi:MAG: shikimate kinase [Patescibacteria group bacterium]|nr:shikimate kinase [Patescibacteria group bacterium]